MLTCVYCFADCSARIIVTYYYNAIANAIATYLLMLTRMVAKYLLMLTRIIATNADQDGQKSQEMESSPYHHWEGTKKEQLNAWGGLIFNQFKFVTCKLQALLQQWTLSRENHLARRDHSHTKYIVWYIISSIVILDIIIISINCECHQYQQHHHQGHHHRFSWGQNHILGVGRDTAVKLTIFTLWTSSWVNVMSSSMWW